MDDLREQPTFFDSPQDLFPKNLKSTPMYNYGGGRNPGKFLMTENSPIKSIEWCNGGGMRGGWLQYLQVNFANYVSKSAGRKTS